MQVLRGGCFHSEAPVHRPLSLFEPVRQESGVARLFAPLHDGRYRGVWVSVQLNGHTTHLIQLVAGPRLCTQGGPHLRQVPALGPPRRSDHRDAGRVARAGARHPRRAARCALAEGHELGRASATVEVLGMDAPGHGRCRTQWPRKHGGGNKEGREGRAAGSSSEESAPPRNRRVTLCRRPAAPQPDPPPNI